MIDLKRRRVQFSGKQPRGSLFNKVSVLTKKPCGWNILLPIEQVENEGNSTMGT